MLSWTEDLATGNPRIDAEHREIYRQMNELGDAIVRGAGSATINELAEVLLNYAHLHFHHEEHAMACAHCPAHRLNCAAHRDFIRRLRAWMCQINSGTFPQSQIHELHRETSLWIKNHIEHIDIRLRPHGPPLPGGSPEGGGSELPPAEPLPAEASSRRL